MRWKMEDKDVRRLLLIEQTTTFPFEMPFVPISLDRGNDCPKRLGLKFDDVQMALQVTPESQIKMK